MLFLANESSFENNIQWPQQKCTFNNKVPIFNSSEVLTTAFLKNSIFIENVKQVVP